MDEVALQEAIDACRPGSLDQSLPEFAELADRLASEPAVRRRFEAVQAFDRAMGAALEEVPVPAGLADRLLAATAAAVPAEAESAHDRVSLPPRSIRTNSRTLADVFDWAAPLALVLVVAAAMGAVMVLSRPTKLTTDELVEQSFQWQDQLLQGEWNERIKTAPRSEFPIDSQVALAPWRWQQLKTNRAELVAYFEGPPGAILFVSRTKTKIVGLGKTPKLLSATGGWSVGAWQSGDLTYVLLVEGDRRKYESHLKTPAAA